MTPKTRRRIWYAMLITPIALFALWADCMFTGFVPRLFSVFHDPRERWGDAALALMREADRIEVIRIDSPTSMPTEFANLPFYGMVARGEPIHPSDDWTIRLRAAVSSSWSYEWYLHSRCLPRPGVCVRFHRGSEVVDLLFCFECDLVSLAPTGKHGGPIQEKWIDFRVKRSPFAELVKELFPNDAAIQAIGR